MNLVISVTCSQFPVTVTTKSLSFISFISFLSQSSRSYGLIATLLTCDNIYKELLVDQTSTVDHFILIAMV